MCMSHPDRESISSTALKHLPELIRATCLVGTAAELIGQMRDLERQGLQELMFATGNDEKWRFAEEFSRQVMARL